LCEHGGIKYTCKSAEENVFCEHGKIRDATRSAKAAVYVNMADIECEEVKGRDRVQTRMP
jgi:hypothetical protein